MREKELMDNVDTKPNGCKVNVYKFSDHNWIPSPQSPDEPFRNKSRREKYDGLKGVALSDYLVLSRDLTASSHPCVPVTL